jgi:hypothetical protein
MNIPGAELFRDKEFMGPGDNFPDELAKNLDTTDVLVVLLSPKSFASKWCRWEYDRFTSNEREQQLEPRVLPILWVKVDEGDLSDDTARRIAKELKPILYGEMNDLHDWTQLRHADWSAEKLRSRVGELANRVKILAARRGRKSAQSLSDI